MELDDAGYCTFDVLHLSSAEAGVADVLLATYDRFVRRANAVFGSVFSAREYASQRIFSARLATNAGRGV
jgi:hypothetical protein